MRRVVITGLGGVTPLACGVLPTWKKLIEGQSGAATAEGFDLNGLRSTVACQIPRGDGQTQFQPDQWLSKKEQDRIDPFMLYGIVAAQQAIEDSGWQATGPWTELSGVHQKSQSVDSCRPD